MLIVNSTLAEFGYIKLVAMHCCPIDAIASQRLVVQREQNESQFAETLQSTFPQLQGKEFEFCRGRFRLCVWNQKHQQQ